MLSERRGRSSAHSTWPPQDEPPHPPHACWSRLPGPPEPDTSRRSRHPAAVDPVRGRTLAGPARQLALRRAVRAQGGMLLAAFEPCRPTADADALARHIANDQNAVLARVVEIAHVPDEDPRNR